MAQVFLTVIRLEFDVKTDRNTVYTALKGTLATLKETAPWQKGDIRKDEYTVTDVTVESV